MGVELNLNDILRDIRAASENMTKADSAAAQRFAGIEQSVNELFKRLARPGAEGGGNDTDERKEAIEYCVLKHDIAAPKVETGQPIYVPTPAEIDEAIIARKAISSLFRTGNVERLDPSERKSLSSFAFGSNQFVLPAQISSRVISCLADETDLAGMMSVEQTSTGSLKFPIDNRRMESAGWACETDCFANNPMPDLQDGLGEMEIKVDPLRFIACAGNDLLADAAFNVENWILRKANDGFRRTINKAIIGGDGIGKPMGILNPNAGIPVCDTASSTTPGQFTWQDLVMLAYEVPIQWHGGASYLMNQRTWALCMTMSDSVGRPLWAQLPGAQPQLIFAGFPVRIVTQMPDVAPGSTPIVFGNWKECYVVVNRAGLTMRPDPYSAGFCVLFRFEARLGGGPLCPNAARLLRVK
jgi:HK97 family phage major capsid protein